MLQLGHQWVTQRISPPSRLPIDTFIPSMSMKFKHNLFVGMSSQVKIVLQQQSIVVQIGKCGDVAANDRRPRSNISRLGLITGSQLISNPDVL
ncbi:hypothetical protein Y032_0111g236 [Ancylostoma ceylanicum]|uniref:Uncharacterized protein n=1 Tax=Ancylostoma ceylanicum TaxID=53326 RepID=A0A016TE92_9BILA|nr:hypothetical protein Y032_0111g236 [Ancylostoma ceylanicum]